MATTTILVISRRTLAGLSLRRNAESNFSMARPRALLMNYFLSYPARKHGVISV